jgi:hypothetical protein
MYGMIKLSELITLGHLYCILMLNRVSWDNIGFSDEEWRDLTTNNPRKATPGEEQKFLAILEESLSHKLLVIEVNSPHKAQEFRVEMRFTKFNRGTKHTITVPFRHNMPLAEGTQSQSILLTSPFKPWGKRVYLNMHLSIIDTKSHSGISTSNKGAKAHHSQTQVGKYYFIARHSISTTPLGVNNPHFATSGNEVYIAYTEEDIVDLNQGTSTTKSHPNPTHLFDNITKIKKS